ncbi:MAG: SUMF1/EgtB/PvdO family nonheme iron enzyme [Clostridia bacterium]|nr:SUMF1/EgtB/PvdO family nonheme iron enzyme [Clostridia bacterium]
MKKVGKEKQKNNFTKLTHKKGISLIVLIVTIIVIIILAAAVILTISKNNPVSSAKEATFKEDVTAIQDELSMYLSKKYTDNPTSFDKSSVNLSGDSMVTELPSTKKYKDKVSIIKGKLAWNGEIENNIEYKWFSEVTDGSTKRSASVRNEWKEKIAEEVEGVPIPKGFTYKEGTKDTGFVIQDENKNEFVWVPATESTYRKDTSFPGAKPTGDDTSLPNGIIDETADVVKYGGFYIGRYEAGIPEGDTSASNKKGIPVSKKDAIIWANINYTNSKASAESMISNEYVQTGLITGTAWDTTCHWIEGSLKSINELASLKDSRYYGNYKNSLAPANENSGTKREAGFSENWKTKNIYDLAGNVWEWTSEVHSSDFIIRGGCFGNVGSDDCPVSYRGSNDASCANDWMGFRLRLYIK